MSFMNKQVRQLIVICTLFVPFLGACNKLYVPDEPAEAGDVTAAPVQPPPTSQPPSVQVHTVQQGEGLYSIAGLYGLNFRELAAWNNILPPVYAIHPGQQLVLAPPASGIPAGGIPAGGSGTPQYHTVQRGETLFGIAGQYGRKYNELAAWNGIPHPYVLEVGQRLLVRPSSEAAAPSPQPGGSAIDFDTYEAGLDLSPQAGSSYSSYTVQRGESLYGIAKRYGLNYRDVAEWNLIPPPYNVDIGQVIRLTPLTAGESVAVAPAPAAPSGGYHTVQRGETLYRLSKRYGMTVPELAALNGLRKPYTLSVGQTLRIGSQVSAASFSTRSVVRGYPSAPFRRYHTVRAGETLAGIATRYRQTMSELALWNGLAPPYRLYVGQTLQIISR
ncbi:MAG: LysM peptidoglycan-binding domain-containing protein [Gammaproteobacteria bacterium]|nr:LysM peptidoglycan-binding domain-containing protein [Gammaproteobacteria bacterium]